MSHPEPTHADTMTGWPEDPFERALAAEPTLRVIDRMVRTLAANAPTRRSKRPFCSACVWESILKPLARHWVGWERGDPIDQAPDAPRDSWEPISLSELLAQPDDRPAAQSVTEKWLRSSAAFDAVTDRWLKLLHDADPANGHGIYGSR
jgi:hypothetical protein